MFYESYIVCDSSIIWCTTLCITISTSSALGQDDGTHHLKNPESSFYPVTDDLSITGWTCASSQKTLVYNCHSCPHSHLCCCEWSTVASLVRHLPGESRHWVGQKQINKTQMFSTLAPPQLLISPLVCVVRWEERERINNGTHPFGLHLVAHFW